MMAPAAKVHAGLLHNGQGVDNFFLDNFETLQSLIAHATMGAGVVSEGWSKHLRAIEATLMEIEKLHQQHLRSGIHGGSRLVLCQACRLVHEIG